MDRLTFHLIPHTHWDREWYLPEAAFTARLVPMLDDLISRLQHDDEIRSFLLDGQTILLEDYLRVRPERAAEVGALVKAGRLQVGPWYVLADEQIPSGESLIRNLLLGTEDSARLGGRLEVLYSPDAFGHPGVWPALGQEFGIGYGVIWRGYGGEMAQGQDRFWWRSPSGREMLVYQLPPAGYEIGVALPRDWAPVRETLVRRAAGPHLPVFIGADHHAPHPDLERLRDRLSALDPASEFRVSRLEEFFIEAAREAKTLPVVVGELRWSYRYAWTLQGVHGTRAPLKRRNSALELSLERLVEPLTALARLAGAADRRALVSSTWRQLVQCHFHDTIGGCASDVVARAAETRMDGVAAAAEELVRSNVHALTGHDPDRAREARAEVTPTLALWNPSASPRGGIVIADVTFFRRDVPVGPPAGRQSTVQPDYEAFSLLAEDGETLPVQEIWKRRDLDRLDAVRHYPDQDEVDLVRIAFRTPPVPGLGLRLLRLGSPAPLSREPFAVAERRTLRNRFLEVAIEPGGGITFLDRHRGERFRHLLTLVGMRDGGDTYTLSGTGIESALHPLGGLRARVLAGGPLFAAIEARWKVVAGSVRLVCMIEADSPTLRCLLDFDNTAVDHRLRFRLPLGIGGVAAVAGAQFGTVSRPPVSVDPAEFPIETPVATAPAHRWVAAAKGSRGLALMSRGFFEYELTAQSDLLMTLLRSVGELSKGDLPTRPGHAGWPTATPLAQCPGSTRIEIALAAVTAEEVDGGTVIPRLWEDGFLPMRGFWMRDFCPSLASPPVPRPVVPHSRSPSPPAERGNWRGSIELEGDGLLLSAIKPAEAGEGMILRCYNATDRVVEGTWRFGTPVRAAYRVRADEQQLRPLAIEAAGTATRFTAAPREIVTVRVD